MTGCHQYTPSSSTATTDTALEEIRVDYFVGKAKLKFSDADKERDVRAHIRIRKDSVIWMNFSVVGMQGGRVLINQDSITVLNNMNKKYYVYTFEQLSKQYNFRITYQSIQAALLGNLVFPGSEITSITTAAGQRLLETMVDSVKVQSYVSVKNNKIVLVNLFSPRLGVRMNLEYSNFQPLETQLFPYVCRFSLHYLTKQKEWRDMHISLDYIKAEVGTPELRFPFKFSRRYVRE